MEVAGIVQGAPAPAWLRRFFGRVGRGIHRFSMIRDRDRVLLGISGGKDSLAMAFALAARRRGLPISYDLEALQIEWEEYPLPESSKASLSAFFAALGIPFSFVRASMFSAEPRRADEPFSCYICSRIRRRILFEEADRRGIRTVALGHHLDDIVETTLINLCFHGTVSGMMPVREFFDGGVRIIRPLCEVKESTTRRVAEAFEFPVVSVECPFRGTNVRASIKPVVTALSRLSRRARENIFRASLAAPEEAACRTIGVTPDRIDCFRSAAAITKHEKEP